MQRPLQKLNHHSPGRILGGDFDEHAKGECLHSGDPRITHDICIQVQKMRGLQKIKLPVIQLAADAGRQTTYQAHWAWWSLGILRLACQDKDYMMYYSSGAGLQEPIVDT